MKMGTPRALAGCWVSTIMVIVTVNSVTSTEQQIHEHMSKNELRSLFHIDDYSDIPDYHLVQLTHHISRRHIPSTHQANSNQKISSKVPHEKYPQKKIIKFSNPPSLLHDEMYKSTGVNNSDVDLLSESDSDMFNDKEHELESDEGVHKINLKVFGKDMELVLVKQEGLVKKDGLKMWTVLKNETQPHGVDYLEMEPKEGETEEDIGELYQDENTGTALLIRRHPTRGSLLVDGSIGHDVVIRPIPDSMADLSMASSDVVEPTPPDDEMFMDEAHMEDMVSIDTGLPIRKRNKDARDRIRRALSGAQHVIFKRKQQDFDHSSDYAFMEPDHLAKKFRRRKRSTSSYQEDSRSSRRKREAPYVIYPEILVIVDYDGYRLHGGDNVQIKRYFVSFWNGVDLRYKLLKGPKIRISIAGIIISRGRDATPYLERNRVGRDAIDSAAALTDMGKYLFRERRLPVYDIAVAITKLDMCRRQYANDACNRGTAGFAYVGGACVVNKRLEKVNSVAIIEDTGGFSGIIVAAHEVGHLLGAVHDGSPPPSYLGGPGAEKCRWEDGYIMSDLRHTEKGFRWSPCSVHSFHHFLNGDTATCLFNSPHDDDDLPRVLPGRLLTLDAQCRKDRGTSACFKDERVCAQLFCFDAGSGYCVAYRPAAEGSPCGDGQYCMNGNCIPEHENIIPDYSQHTPSFIRADTSPFYGLNITSYEASTQPYRQEITPDIYLTSTRSPETYNSVYTYTMSTSSVVTENPYKYYFHSTTKTPYDYNSYTVGDSKSTSYTTQNPYTYKKYSLSTTKSPYNFNDFPKYYEETTKKSKLFGKLELDPSFGKPTTRNPFGFTYKSAVKPLFKFGTLYERNDIRPDANSQDGVEVDPKKMGNGYQSSISSVRFGVNLCLGADARLRPECQPQIGFAHTNSVEILKI